MSRRPDPLAEIETRRRAVEERLAAVRSALASETGRAPRRRGVLTALIAGAVGLAVALRRRDRRRAAQPGDELPRPARER